MARWKKWTKRAGKRIARQVKATSRQAAPIRAKIAPYVTAIGAGVATVFAGPAAGAAVSAAGAMHGQRLGAQAARARGKSGREARAEGRKVRKRTLIYAGAATGVAAIGTAIAGGSLLTGLAGAGTQAASAIAPKSGAPGAPAQNQFDFGLDLLGTPAGVAGGEGTGLESAVYSLSGQGRGESVPGTGGQKGAAGPTRPFDVTGSLVDLGASILGGGLSRDPGTSKGPVSAPGEDGKPGSFWGGFTGPGGEGGEPESMLKNPLVLGALVLGGFFLLKAA